MNKILARFNAKWAPEPNTGCWLWTGFTNPKGYGTFGVARSTPRLAHRVSWMLYKGDIPDTLQVQHTCNTSSCVNPDHLILGTAKKNAEYMSTSGRAFNSKKRLCKFGHEFELVKWAGKSRRVCRVCARNRAAYA